MSSSSILFIVSSLAPGGTEKKTVMIANRLSEKGHSVFLAYLNGPEYFLDSINDKVGILRVDRKSKLDFNAVKRIRRFIFSNNIQHIVAMNMYPMLYVYLATLLKRRQVKVLASINTTKYRDKKGALLMFLYAPIMMMMDQIIFGCHYQKKLWIKKYFIPRRISTVIYNGVDTAFYSEAESRESTRIIKSLIGICDDEIVIGTVGRLRDEKGHKYTLESTKLLISEGIKLKLIVVGDGPMRECYEDLARQMGIKDSVIFAGNQTDVRGYLGLMDIFVLSSVAVETFSNAVLEAMSMQKPVVATNISGIPEMIRDGQNGYLVNPARANEMAIAIKKLIPKEKRKLFSENARSRVESEFSVDRMIADYESIMGL